MTIHGTHPFATPDEERSPLRRLRGRMPATVTLWTAYGRDGRPSGLTVSSTVVADGSPGSVLGLIDEESDLYEAVRHAGRFAVTVLDADDAQLADRFAGLMPAPGGLFRDEEWDRTAYGPVARRQHAWAGCALTATKPVGYAVLVEGSVERIELGVEGEAPLIHHRGRYVKLTR